MAIRTHLIASSLIVAFAAVGCTITSDNKGSIFDNNDAGSTGGTASGGGGSSSTAGTTSHAGHSNGNGDAAVSPIPDASSSGGEPDAGNDSGSQFMCVAPNGDHCSDCVANNCLAEYCACEGDSACGGDTGELQCIMECMRNESTMGTTVDDAFATCSGPCIAIGQAVLADATNNAILCIRAAIPDPLFADAGAVDGGTPEVAQCGDTCLGYYEPATP